MSLTSLKGVFTSPTSILEVKTKNDVKLATAITAINMYLLNFFKSALNLDAIREAYIHLSGHSFIIQHH